MVKRTCCYNNENAMTSELMTKRISLENTTPPKMKINYSKTRKTASKINHLNQSDPSKYWISFLAHFTLLLLLSTSTD